MREKRKKKISFRCRRIIPKTPTRRFFNYSL